MIRTSTAGRLVAAALSLLLAPAALRAALPFAGVSLTISNDAAPPGGITQIKVLVTEPKPISTGGMRFDFSGFDGFAGIAAMSETNDAFGVADVRGSQIRFAIFSPTSSIGTDSDYPILTVAARVPATAPVDSVIPISIAGDAIRLLDPTGAVYPLSLKDGSVTVKPGISIEDVTPGSADLPAGSAVTIVGRGFTPATKVRFNNVILSSVRYLDATHMRVVVASPARMHGMRIRAENPNGPKTVYFSYQRTRPQGTSLFPTLQNSVPLFPLRLVTQALVEIPGVSTALALQNLADVTAPVLVDLLAPDGRVLATRITSVDPSRFKVREISELFGIAYVAGFSVRARSLVPIQVMGIQVDAAGNATPIASR